MFKPDAVIIFNFLEDATKDIKVKREDHKFILEALITHAKMEFREILDLTEFILNDDAFIEPFIIKQIVHQLDESLAYEIDKYHFNNSKRSYINHELIAIINHKIIQDDDYNKEVYEKIKFSKRVISFNVCHKMRRKLIMYLFTRLNDMVTGFKQVAKTQELMNLDNYRNKKYKRYLERFVHNNNLVPSGYFDLSNGTFVVVDNKEEYINKYYNEE